MNQFNNMKSNNELIVKVKRGSYVESVHKVHAVVCDIKGRILVRSGNPNYETFIRSALKPFQAIPFLTSGALEKIGSGEKSLAIACGSHNGNKLHAREAFKILWNSDIDVSKLKCPIPKGKKSNLEHNCSGKHAAFLSTCSKMSWDEENYLDLKHPLQKEIIRILSELIGVNNDSFKIERDNCGALTVFIKLSQIALLYAHLSGSYKPELEQISRAMVNNPMLIAGDGVFDTELMKRAHKQILSKGGSEGIQCLGRVSEGIGIAIKAEDGSKRAKHAVALHILKQLEWLTPIALEELEEKTLQLKPGVQIRVEGNLN